MSKPSSYHQYSSVIVLSVMLVGLTFIMPCRVFAQQPANYEKDRNRAAQLLKEKNYAKALPVLEKLAASNQSDRTVMYGLGVALLMNAVESKKPNEQKQMLLRARTALLRAKNLGEASEFLHQMLSWLSAEDKDIHSEAEKLAILIDLHPPYIFDEKPKDGIRLLEGYRFRSGSNFEGSGGEIYKEAGLYIWYEFGFSQGFAADPKEKEKFSWYREIIVNKRKVMLALIKPGLKTQFEPDNPRSPELGNILIITFDMGDNPENESIATNFYAEVLNAEEMADMILMVLTYNPK